MGDPDPFCAVADRLRRPGEGPPDEQKQTIARRGLVVVAVGGHSTLWEDLPVNRLLVSLTLACALAAPAVAAPTPSLPEPPKAVERMTEGLQHLQEGVPVLLRVLKVLQREGPALLELSQQAASEAYKRGGPMTPHVDGSMPSAEEMAQKLDALRALAEVMRKAPPILTRIQKELDPDRL